MTAQFKIGADPELFVRNKKTGTVISAHDLIPGNKKAPAKVSGGAVQPDGLAAEFNIDPVDLNDFNAFDNALLGVMKQLMALLPADHGFAIEPSNQFDAEYYASLPESAKELGCEPDYCAYSEDPMEPNQRPNGDSGLRSAAGHIHIGWGADIPADHPDHIDVCRAFIRQLDFYVGMGMTAIDNDDRRRQLYGKAGAFRPKSYGVEYRTPSNVWLKSRSYRRFIHRLVSMAINDMTNGRVAEQLYPNVNAREIINSGDRTSAVAFLAKLGVNIPTLEG